MGRRQLPQGTSTDSLTSMEPPPQAAVWTRELARHRQRRVAVARWREHRDEMAVTAPVERLLLDTACAGARELEHVAQRVRDERRAFDVRWAAWEKRAKAQVGFSRCSHGTICPFQGATREHTHPPTLTHSSEDETQGDFDVICKFRVVPPCESGDIVKRVHRSRIHNPSGHT